MLSSLLRYKTHSTSVLSSNGNTSAQNGNGAADDSQDDGDDDDAASSLPGRCDQREPLLPIFAAHLDSIPVYRLVHAIRSDVITRCDTPLTWEQLRAPQVTSFLVKPILSTLLELEGGASKGLLYSLLANCLQFRKEATENPANAGTLGTRGNLCEMLAMKCLKEFSDRELIDALSYDFYPLQGMPEAEERKAQLLKRPSTIRFVQKPAEATRISALELAIRAQAKKFVAHPVAVQQLEAIWAGNIVFHSLYDHLHRTPEEQLRRKGRGIPVRRSATLYNGSDASLFKLSRLRVPRYRHILSTISLSVLLVLHLLVLVQRSRHITPLEIIFWLWSCGFMIDELVDIGESGISLYLMSLWNTFDVGIFLLFVAFYAMRIIGLVRQDKQMTDWSYDVLASCSIFLFPRIFSVMDHFQYFSQLIIAFRIMAVDMVALLIVIGVACSGFFVAFTFSFARETFSAADISYALFQMLMGYTPAAWESWSYYNLFGKFLLSAFLIICHFLIVTILITVLTNSFAAVAANAQEEHQFLTAVNTISLVKNESLFTYVAPLNLLAWVLHPLRYMVPFKKFICINRLAVKVTHLPILLIIFLYERRILRHSFFADQDIGNHDHVKRRTSLAALQKPGGDDADSILFSPVRHKVRRRESVGSHMQAKVLEEVFRKPFNPQPTANGPEGDVDNWMNGVISASPSKVRTRFLSRSKSAGRVQGLGTPPPLTKTYGSMNTVPQTRDTSAVRSVLSDPEEFATSTGAFGNIQSETENAVLRTDDDDADNEQNSGDEGEETVEDEERPLETLLEGSGRSSERAKSVTSKAPGPVTNERAPPLSGRRGSYGQSRCFRPKLLKNRSSSTTILLQQLGSEAISSDSDANPRSVMTKAHRASNRTSTDTAPVGVPRSRIGIPVTQRNSHRTPPAQGSPLRRQSLHGQARRRSRSISEISDFLTNGGGNVQIPASFMAQMDISNGRSAADNMLNEILLARIGTLEKSVGEMKDLLKEVAGGRGRRRAGDGDRE